MEQIKNKKQNRAKKTILYEMRKDQNKKQLTSSFEWHRAVCPVLPNNLSEQSLLKSAFTTVHLEQSKNNRNHH